MNLDRNEFDSPCSICPNFYCKSDQDTCRLFCEEYKLWVEEGKIGLYLAGSIDHVSPEEAMSWRQKATAVLESIGFKIFDPTVGKDLDAPGINTTYYTPSQIVSADLKMIRKSRIILAEISRKDKPYHGTSMELAYSHIWGKRIYVWGGCQSYWVRYHSNLIFGNLDQALDYLVDTYHMRRVV